MSDSHMISPAMITSRRPPMFDGRPMRKLVVIEETKFSKRTDDSDDDEGGSGADVEHCGLLFPREHLNLQLDDFEQWRD